MEYYTFCEAIEKKFGSKEADKSFDNIIITTRNGNSSQMRNLNKRKILALDGCNINCSGKYGEIKDICPLLVELDLSSNCMEKWEHIFNITSQLQHLKFLNLSHNPLPEFSVTDDAKKMCVPKIEKLAVNNIRFSFNTLINLLSVFSSVTEVHASLNGFGKVEEGDVQFANIKSVYFSKNDITSWKDVQNLALYFPSLETLIVSENPIKRISEHEVDPTGFKSLQKLSIGETLISQWDCLDRLHSLPALSDLRFVKIPLWNNYLDDKLRQRLFIARYPKIRIMNGGKIQEHEREDAERAFIRYYRTRKEQPQRYFDLVNVYGHINELADVEMRQPDNAVVTLFGDINKETILKVDQLQSTCQFRKYIAKMYDIPLSKLRLFHHDTGSAFGSVEMKTQIKRLTRYRMKDGDRIEVQRLDVGR